MSFQRAQVEDESRDPTRARRSWCDEQQKEIDKKALEEVESMVQRVTEFAHLKLRKLHPRGKHLLPEVARDRLQRAAKEAAGEKCQSRAGLLRAEEFFELTANQAMIQAARLAPYWLWGVAGPWSRRHGIMLSVWKDPPSPHEGAGDYFDSISRKSSFALSVRTPDYSLMERSRSSHLEQTQGEVPPGTPDASEMLERWCQVMENHGLPVTAGTRDHGPQGWSTSICHGAVPVEINGQGGTRDESLEDAARNYLGWSTLRAPAVPPQVGQRAGLPHLFSPLEPQPDILPGGQAFPFLVTCGGVSGKGDWAPEAFSDWCTNFERKHGSEMALCWRSLKTRMQERGVPKEEPQGSLLEAMFAMEEDKWEVEFSWSGSPDDTANVVIWYGGSRLSVMGGCTPWEAVLLAFRELESALWDETREAWSGGKSIHRYGDTHGVPLVQLDLVSGLFDRNLWPDRKVRVPPTDWDKFLSD